MSKAGRERRLKKFSLDPQSLCDWLAGRVMLTLPALPEGAEFITAQSAFDMHAIQVLVAHPSFEPVSFGTEIPSLGPLYVEVTQKGGATT